MSLELEDLKQKISSLSAQLAANSGEVTALRTALDLVQTELAAMKATPSSSCIESVKVGDGKTCVIRPADEATQQIKINAARTAQPSVPAD